MRRYSFSELFSLDHYLPPSDCTQNALQALQLFQRPRSSHWDSCRGLYASLAGINVLCSYSRGSGHSDARAICMSNLFYPQMSLGNMCNKIITAKIRIAQLNVQSMNKKVSLLHDIILKRKLDFFVFARRDITQKTVTI